MLLAAALLAALAAIAVAVAAMRQSARWRTELEAARSRLARIDAELPRIEQHGTISATALRRDVRVSFEVSAAREDRAVIVQLLIDFRDVSGAEEASTGAGCPTATRSHRRCGRPRERDRRSSASRNGRRWCSGRRRAG
jgi:hypothetical protein